MSSRDECSCEKTRRRWKALRVLLFLAGVSLVLYMPYKAAMQYESLREIYGPWFLQGAVVAVAGVLFALRPGFAAAVPLWARLGIGGAALLWMRTGLACTPSLVNQIQASLTAGGFASMHMLVQHVFLSLGVVGFAAAPRFVGERMGADVAPDAATADPVSEPAA